jgi:HSP20 family protein
MLRSKKSYPMKSDVRERKDAYILDIDLPGFGKDDIKAYLEDGYLIISAVRKKEKDRKNARYLRQERYSGAYKRSFFIGHQANQEDIKAAYKRGVLRLIIPKTEAKETSHNGMIAIA